MGKGNNYDNFFKLIPTNTYKDIKTIFEIGSRDALDAITAHNLFKPTTCHVFECNPTLIKQCEDNIAKYPNIHLCNKAVFIEDNKLLSFTFPIMLPGSTESWNGMGSLNGKIKKEYWINTNHEFKNLNNDTGKFTTCEVNTIRLDSYCKENSINQIDLIMMDVEGVPLKILKSYGEKIRHVKYIISEVYYKNIFEVSCDLFDELNDYLQENGFKLILNNKKNPYFGNAMWSVLE